MAFGAAVFNNQESRPDSRTLYFLIWRILTQITQAGPRRAWKARLQRGDVIAGDVGATRWESSAG